MHLVDPQPHLLVYRGHDRAAHRIFGELRLAHLGHGDQALVTPGEAVRCRLRCASGADR